MSGLGRGLVALSSAGQRRGSVGLLEGRQDEKDLDHGGPAIAVVGRDELALIRGKKIYAPVAEVLQPVGPGPKTEAQRHFLPRP